MIRALLLKELKETMWIWSIAAIVFLLFVLSTARVRNVPIFESSVDEIPFVTPRIAGRIGVITALLAIGLGIWQTYGESWRGTFPPLLNLPMSRRKVFAAKLAVGLGLTWGLAGTALAAVCFWASMPGTHASPFEWSMTVFSWQVWLAVPLMYLGSFATGLFQARWFGPQLFPLLAAFLVFTILKNAGDSLGVSVPAFVALVLFIDGVYLIALDYLIHSRDFS